jgi:UDP-N-acetylglucosamine 4-epimerase
MNLRPDILKTLKERERVWLITGVAGFIGSHLLENLLNADQRVIGVDNFITGRVSNLKDVENIVGEKRYQNFKLLEGSITDLSLIERACSGLEWCKVDVILHQAALGSVPRSIENPLASNEANISGSLTLKFAAKEAGIKRLVYASSSSVYGDDKSDVKREEVMGEVLSPYAATKRCNEIYAGVFGKLFDLETIGLRYFNVFGVRQDPNGPYAAVIPKWLGNLVNEVQCTINGDGLTSRDFCFIRNVVEANLLAATYNGPIEDIKGEVFNIACGDTTSLKDLHSILVKFLVKSGKHKAGSKHLEVIHGPFRKGDIRHSLADISKAKRVLGYEARYSVKEGLAETVAGFIEGR